MIDLLGNEYKLNYDSFQVIKIEDYGDQGRDSIVVQFSAEGKLAKVRMLPRILAKFNTISEYVSFKVSVIYWPAESAYNSIWIEVAFAEQGDGGMVFAPIDTETGCVASFLGTKDNYINEGLLTDEEIRVITGEALHAVSRKAYNEIVM